MLAALVAGDAGVVRLCVGARIPCNPVNPGRSAALILLGGHPAEVLPESQAHDLGDVPLGR